MTHVIHSSDTVKDCAPAVVHALVTFLGAICRLHSVSDVADAARNWARLCEALVSVHLKATMKQVQAFDADLCFISLIIGDCSMFLLLLNPGFDCERHFWFLWSYCSLLRVAFWP